MKCVVFSLSNIAKVKTKKLIICLNYIKITKKDLRWKGVNSCKSFSSSIV